MAIPRCPICYELIFEPVVFLCRHEICRGCFRQSVETANFCCPLCRLRVSSWARKHAKDPVDHERMKAIHQQFSDPQPSPEPKCWPILCQPGEIRQEYLIEVEKHHTEQKEEERLGELEARRLLQEEEQIIQHSVESDNGEELARNLQQEEAQQILQQQLQLQKDREMAEALETQMEHQEAERLQQVERDRSIAEEMKKSYSMKGVAVKRPASNWTFSKRKKLSRRTLRSTGAYSPYQPISLWLKPSVTSSSTTSRNDTENCESDERMTEDYTIGD